jgi:hypothetical protein
MAGIHGNAGAPGDIRLAGRKLGPGAENSDHPSSYIGGFDWYQIPNAPVTMEVFWNHATQQINIRANFQGGSRESGFFTQVHGGDPPGEAGQPQFDFVRNVSPNTDFFSIGAITGAHDLDAEFLEYLATLPPLSFNPIPDTIPNHSSILPASTAKISHARIIRGERTPSQAQNFHEIMKEKKA